MVPRSDIFLCKIEHIFHLYKIYLLLNALFLLYYLSREGSSHSKILQTDFSSLLEFNKKFNVMCIPEEPTFSTGAHTFSKANFNWIKLLVITNQLFI